MNDFFESESSFYLTEFLIKCEKMKNEQNRSKKDSDWSKVDQIHTKFGTQKIILRFNIEIQKI